MSQKWKEKRKQTHTANNPQTKDRDWYIHGIIQCLQLSCTLYTHTHTYQSRKNCLPTHIKITWPNSFQYTLRLSHTQTCTVQATFIIQHINSKINITITDRDGQRHTHSCAACYALYSFVCSLTGHKFSNTQTQTQQAHQQNEHLINDNDLKEIKIPMSKSHHSSPIYTHTLTHSHIRIPTINHFSFFFRIQNAIEIIWRQNHAIRHIISTKEKRNSLKRFAHFDLKVSVHTKPTERWWNRLFFLYFNFHWPRILTHIHLYTRINGTPEFFNIF